MAIHDHLANSGFSPGRTVSVEFDSVDFTLSQPPLWRTFEGLEITGKSDNPGTVKVHYVNGIGFQLETYHDRLEIVHEENALAAERRSVESGLVAFTAHPRKSVPTQPGVPTGSQVEGDDHNQAQINAVTDWDDSAYNLNGTDEASYPKPSEDEIVNLDRRYVDTAPMQPDQTLWMRFRLPGGGSGDALGAVMRVYFTGLASTPTNAPHGTGQYALTILGSGRAYLWEKTTSVWTLRRQFRWSPPALVMNAWHIIAIRSDAYLAADGLWHGSVINFECQATQSYSEAVLAVGGGLVVGGNTTQYVVPQSVPQHITMVPPRLDIRREVRAKISLSYSKFFASGTLYSQVFTVHQKLGAVLGVDPVIRVTCFGSFPEGTSVSIQLYGFTPVAGGPGTTAACVVDGPSGSSDEQTWKSFDRVEGCEQYLAVLTFNASSDLKQTPTVRRMDVVRDGAAGLGAATPFTMPREFMTHFSVFGPSSDPKVETASIGLIGLQDGFTEADNGVVDPIATLSARTGQSCRIDLSIPSTTVNGGTATTSTLFLGKAVSLRKMRLGVKRWKQMLLAGVADVAEYPSRTWWQGSLALAGLWRRLLQAKTPKTLNFARKEDGTDHTYRVTTAIRLLLSNIGCPPQMIDIPDLPITLQYDPNDKAKAGVLEPFSEAFDTALEFARDYLGAAIVIDANATNQTPLDFADKYGCVRLKLPPRPNQEGKYPPIAKFVDDATWTDGTLREKLNLNSYSRFMRDDGATIPVCPRLGGTLEEWDEAAEGNMVYVTGSAAVVKSQGSVSQGETQGLLWATIYNYPACHFYDGQPIEVDPTHPDYTDGTPFVIVIIDPSLNTQGIVNFVARRTFDLSCHRRKYMRFQAPLVLVVDPLDTKQIRPRPLAWGDCVLVNDETWFVSHVSHDTNGELGGSRNASALYELFRVPELEEIRDGQPTVYQQGNLYAAIAGQRA